MLISISCEFWWMQTLVLVLILIGVSPFCKVEADSFQAQCVGDPSSQSLSHRCLNLSGVAESTAVLPLVLEICRSDTEAKTVLVISCIPCWRFWVQILALFWSSFLLMHVKFSGPSCTYLPDVMPVLSSVLLPGVGLARAQLHWTFREWPVHGRSLDPSSKCINK